MTRMGIRVNFLTSARETSTVPPGRGDPSNSVGVGGTSSGANTNAVGSYVTIARTFRFLIPVIQPRMPLALWVTRIPGPMNEQSLPAHVRGAAAGLQLRQRGTPTLVIRARPGTDSARIRLSAP